MLSSRSQPRFALWRVLLPSANVASAMALSAAPLGRTPQVVAGIEETLYYYAFPQEHWRHLRTNNPLKLLLREVRRRTRAVGAFPDGKSALTLAAARLRHGADTKWGTRRYLVMNRFAEASEAA